MKDEYEFLGLTLIVLNHTSLLCITDMKSLVFRPTDSEGVWREYVSVRVRMNGVQQRSNIA